MKLFIGMKLLLRNGQIGIVTQTKEIYAGPYGYISLSNYAGKRNIINSNYDIVEIIK